MLSIKKNIRTGTLYIVSLMLVAGAPLSAYAEEAPAETQSTPQSQTAEPTTKEELQTPSTTETPAQTTPTQSTDATKETQSSQQQTTASQPNGTDSATTTTDSTHTTDTKSSNTIDTTNESTAKSGDANVSQNTNAGSATSGDATSQTTVVNSVHSTVGNGDKTGIAYFTTDINGNVYGDITISPSINDATQVSNANMSSATNVDNNNAITNTINSSSTSGNATVSENTNAGSATTGNANTVANVMNLINTIISANKSFVGTINIYGDLDGDILVSPEFIPQLLGSNSTTSSVNTNLSANLESDQQIVNNIKLKATSGDANVTDNTTAGSATTGTAQTNLTILNLTGHQVTAKNSLLVFVNVLGKWVGMIVDAPAGTTAAALGNGVTSNSVLSNTAINVSDTAKITNNIDLSATTGNATVSKNTVAGNATSGNATASANIANISASAFSVSDWFGVLFINVFGTWLGSFGVDTANGNVVPIATPLQQTASANSPAPFAFGFTPKAQASTQNRASTTLSSRSIDTALSEPANDSQTTAPSVLGANTVQVQPEQNLTENPSPRANPFNDIMMYAGFGVAALGAAIFALRRNV